MFILFAIKLITFTFVKSMKRLMDFCAALLGLIIFAPVLGGALFFVWRHDRTSPLYIAERSGLHGKPFKMIKLRSMIKEADKSHIDSTGADDKRITAIGSVIRKYKLDELTQLWNVLVGEMSLVGPRPNVKRETDLYTVEEKRLLLLKPGITDFASIVFSDEGEILRYKRNPDVAYNQLIRPGKGLLGLFYIEKQSLLVDLQIIFLTIISIFSRDKALYLIVKLLKKLGAPASLSELASRKYPLVPSPPPGGKKLVTTRNVLSQKNEGS